MTSISNRGAVLEAERSRVEMMVAKYFQMHNLKSEGISGGDLHGDIYGQTKAHAQVRMNAFVLGERFLQIGIRFR